MNTDRNYIDHTLLERLASQAWADSTHAHKSATWETAMQNHWRAKVLSVCSLYQSGSIGKTLVSAIWSEA